jgi:hypothetical protein
LSHEHYFLALKSDTFMPFLEEVSQDQVHSSPHKSEVRSKSASVTAVAGRGSFDWKRFVDSRHRRHEGNGLIGCTRFWFYSRGLNANVHQMTYFYSSL